MEHQWRISGAAAELGHRLPQAGRGIERRG
jgi:hypothetical protein